MLSEEIRAVIGALDRIMIRRRIYRKDVAAGTGIPNYRVRELLDGREMMSLQEYVSICHACSVDPTLPLAMASAGRQRKEGSNANEE